MQGTVSGLRAMNLGDLLDATFALYRRNFVLFAGIAAVLGIPQAIVNIVAAATRPAVPQFPNSSSVTTTEVTTYMTHLGQYTIPTVVSGLVGFLLGLIVTGALARAIAARYLGEPMSIKEAYISLGVGRFVTLLVASIVLTFGGIIGLGIAVFLIALAAALLTNIIGPIAIFLGVLLGIAVVVAAIYLGVSFLFFPEVIVLEGKGVFSCFSRSRKLVSGSWWRVLGIYIVLAILSGILTSVAGGVAIGLLRFASATTAAMVGAAINSVAAILVQPFQLGAMVLLYYDLRIRKEGFDLERMAQTLGTEYS